jgi:hypothetical protein
MTTANGNGHKERGAVRREVGFILALRLIDGLDEKIEAAEAAECKAKRKMDRINEGQVLLKTQMAALDTRIADLAHVVDRFINAAMPAPENEGRQLMAAQRERLALGKQFEDGRTQLESASKCLERERTAIRRIAATALEVRCSELGAAVREMIQPDAEYLSAFPTSTPKAVRDLQRDAAETEKIHAQLTGRVGVAYDAFEKAAGGVAIEIMDRMHGSLSNPLRAAVC